MKSFDVAIIGLGTMGSMTALELASRRVSVVGLDQFAPPHDRGSHSGETRIFRVAYYEHPNYTPLAQRSGVLWDRLGEEAGTRLLNRSGLLSMGTEENEIIRGIRASARLHDLAVESLSAAEIRKQFPALNPPDDFVGLLERKAGWIDVDQSIQVVLAKARSLGVQMELNNSALEWKTDNRQVLVKTRTEQFIAQKLVITAGAWSYQVLRELSLPLILRRKVLVWIDPIVPEHFKPGALPTFAFSPNFFYGFPNIGTRGVKVAEHAGGISVQDPADPIAPPGEADLAPLLKAASEFLPSLVGPPPGDSARVIRAKTCFYTMTPDEHFIIDQHPRFENVFFAAGFSGHGFKFSPLVGEVLADLALEGKTALPIEFLRLNGRFTWRDPRALNHEGHE